MIKRFIVQVIDIHCHELLKEKDFLNGFGDITASPSPFEGEDRWGQKRGALCLQ